MPTLWTNKSRLEAVLAGQIPDVPPHWELVFQLGKEMMGIDLETLNSEFKGTEAARQAFMLKHELAVNHQLIDDYGWAAVPCVAPEQATAYKNEFGRKALVVGFDWEGVFWMPSGGNFMGFVEKLFEAPETLHAEARLKCDAAKRRLASYADNGADFFVLAYDFGFNDAPFISPTHFREFVTPYLAEVVQAAHDLKKKAILHSDGCLTQILEQLHSTGIDGYQSIDPQGHMDIQEVRRQYPDWILMGNVECRMLQDCKEEQIRQSVRYCMQHGGVGKRYIFSTSNCIFHGMPPESYRIMLDEYRKICTAHTAL